MNEPPHERARPSALHSIVRIGLILSICAALLVCTIAITAAGVFRGLNPDLALRFLPFDARANASSASRMLARNGTRMLVPAQRRAARALMRDPTAVDAAATLGIVAGVQRRNDLADRRFRYAERMSRRELATQLWFIERNVQANDVAGALRHYNLALSSSYAARQQLIPILITASSDRGIIGPLRALLRTNPGWRDSFFERLISEGSDPRAMVAVTTGLLDSRREPDRLYVRTLMGRLEQMGAFEQAWQAWNIMSANPAPASALRDGQFRVADGLPPFNWIYSAQAGLMSDRRPRENPADGFALLLPASDRDGEVARQLLRLAAGRHEIEAQVGAVGADQAARPRLLIRCAREGGGKLVDMPFPQASPAGAPLHASISVPQNCPFQWLAILVRGNLDGADAGGGAWIGSIRIR